MQMPSRHSPQEPQSYSSFHWTYVIQKSCPWFPRTTCYCTFWQILLLFFLLRMSWVFLRCALCITWRPRPLWLGGECREAWAIQPLRDYRKKAHWKGLGHLLVPGLQYVETPLLYICSVVQKAAGWILSTRECRRHAILKTQIASQNDFLDYLKAHLVFSLGLFSSVRLY